MKKWLLALCIFFGFAHLQAQQKQLPISVIFDSDMGPDYDDVGAIAMLHAFADSGYFRILATVASTKYANVAPVFSVLNTYFGRPNLPIGVPHQNGLDLRDGQHWSDSLVARYPHAIKQNSDVPEATEVYRKILAAQPDGSVTIVTVGFFTNLANLLRSGPDKYSKQDGKALVRQKVKELVSMAGKFPSGPEFNVDRDPASSQYVFEAWPTPVLLSGFEIGEKIKVGLPLIQNNSIQGSPVKDVFRIAIPMAKEDSAGRMSWDETAVLVAAKGYKPWYDVQKGTMLVDAKGENTWRADGGRHAHLVAIRQPAEVQAIIERMIQHKPSK